MVLTVILAIVLIRTLATENKIEYQRVPHSERFLTFGKYTTQEKSTQDEQTNSSTLCSCIAYLREQGIEIRGDAMQIQPNWGGDPEPGFVVLFKYHDKNTGERVGHAALIRAVFPGGLWIEESNFTHCTATQRLIAWTDPHIRGIFRPPES